MSLIRWCLTAKDRVGMVLDVVQVFSRFNVNLSAMEVAPGEAYVIFDGSGEEAALKEALLEHVDILEVSNVELLPQEKREKQLQAILQSISEGVIAVDKEGAITHLNPTAAVLLQLKPEEVKGKPLREVLHTDLPMLEVLSTGETYDNQEIFLETNRGTLHYLTSGRPIKSEQGDILGAVAALKSMQAVRKMVHNLTKTQTVKFTDIIHASPGMANVIQIAKTVADSNSTILIRGESGTGKELFARAMHEESWRREGPFTPINCAALPETLLESELFGYEEGAFSGAKKGGKQGLFEVAHNGTLFLDEIGELSLVLQGKLLRAIQEGVIRRVGGQTQVSVDVRLITATNRDLEEMVREKQFRQDLYYRLNVIPINVPPLREHPEDIPLLLEHSLKKLCEQMGKQLWFSSEVLRYLQEYSWPGNVRELQNVVERAVHLASNGQIEMDHLLLDSWAKRQPISSLTDDKTIKETMDRTERTILEAALRKHGSARAAARNLGLSHTAVLKKVHHYNLEHLLKR